MTEKIFSPTMKADISKIVRKTFGISLAYDTFKHCFCSQSEMQQLKSLILEAIKTANIHEITRMSVLLFECIKLSVRVFGISKHIGQFCKFLKEVGTHKNHN